ncbi:putative ribonuclease H-like domain-containing protein [Tanacetum coccineum]
MRPFGCPVTILNTIDHLGKFDGKADEGFFVGYSINSKAFRVFNSRNMIVEENLHVQFIENRPNIAGSGPNWLFNIDTLTKSMNYKLVIGNQSNGNAGTKECDDAGKARIETNDPSNEGDRVDKEKNDSVDNTNNINIASDGNNTNNVITVSSTVNTVGIKVNTVSSNTSIELPNDPNMLELENIMYLDDYEDVGAEADMNNLDTFMPVSPIPTTRVHKDQEPKKVIHALKDPSWIEAMRDELLQFKLQKVLTLVDLPNGKRAIGTHKKKGLTMMKSLPLLLEFKQLDPDFPDRVYKVEKAHYGLHQDPRAWHETLSTYLLDNRFQRGKIDNTLFIRRDKCDILLVQVYIDDIIFGSIKKSLCTEFEQMMHKKFQMSSMGELTFFLGLQTANTPMETQKPLLKDEDGEEIDAHLYRLMIGSLMYLTSSRPDIMFAVCACARYQVNPKVSYLYSVKRIFRYLKGQPKLGLWYPKDSPFDLVAYTNSDYARASLDRKSITGATNQKFNFSKYIFGSMVKNLDNAVKFLMYPRKQKSRKLKEKDTEIPQSSVPSDPTNVADEAVTKEPCMQLKELMDLCTKLQQRVLNMENTKTAQAQEITILKKRVKKFARVVSSEEASLGDQEDASKQGRKIDDIDKDAEITLVDETQGRYGDEDMFGVNDLDGDEVVIESEVTDKAGVKRNIIEEVIAMNDVSSRPKTKWVAMQEPSESTPTISLQLPSHKGQGLKDKGKAKMIEPEKPLKKKDQIKFDEEEDLRLQEKFDEEDRLAREKAQQVEEANIAWGDIQEKIDADYQLAERLQAQEQQELTIEEKSTLFVQLLKKRKKHFAAKRAEENRNRPPTLLI